METPSTTAQLLAAEGIADYAQDLRQLSPAALRDLFAFASSGKMGLQALSPSCRDRHDADHPEYRIMPSAELSSPYYSILSARCSSLYSA